MNQKQPKIKYLQQISIEFLNKNHLQIYKLWLNKKILSLEIFNKINQKLLKIYNQIYIKIT